MVSQHASSMSSTASMSRTVPMQCTSPSLTGKLLYHWATRLGHWEEAWHSYWLAKGDHPVSSIQHSPRHPNAMSGGQTVFKCQFNNAKTENSREYSTGGCQQSGGGFKARPQRQVLSRLPGHQSELLTASPPGAAPDQTSARHFWFW